MDVNDIEHIQFNALGGADKITVNNLAGTDVTQVDIDLAGTPGGTQGDGAADLVTVKTAPTATTRSTSWRRAPRSW